MAKRRRGRSRTTSKHTSQQSSTHQSGEAPQSNRSSYGRWLIGTVVLLLVAAATVLLVRGNDAEPDELAELPPPMLGATHSSVSTDDFVGSAACGECHQTQYGLWQASTHGRAGGRAEGANRNIIAPFNGRPMRFADATVIPSVSNGRYIFTVREDGQDEVVFTVDGVIGGGHMVGGGTEGFVSEFPDGTLRFLPFDWIRDEQLWFCNTITRADRGWSPITPQMYIADCGDWPPVRVLGTHELLPNCQECHGSQIVLEYELQERSYKTHVTELAVNCESCHGPGAEHVSRARSDNFAAASDLAIRTFATAHVDTSLAVCYQCHAVKTVLTRGYLPGEVFEEHYSRKLEMFGEPPLFPDGRVRTFAYQENHEYSDCYLSGSMSCVDCHDPHSNDYRDIYGQILENRFSDGQCLDCHPSKADDVPAHTKHAAASPGSRCVSCHMPYLQHPELGDQLRFARSDHTIPIPRPAFDDSLGIENACSQCHADMPVQQLQQQVAAWYGEIKPHKDIITALLTVDQTTNRVEALQRLLPETSNHSLALVQALGEFMQRFLRPDMVALEPEVVDRLKVLAGHRDLDIRAVSLSALHLARGRQRDVRRFLVDQLTSLTPEVDHLVRRRWVIALGYMGDSYRARGDLLSATVAYRKAIEVTPDDAAILAQLADTYANLDQFETALEFFTRSLDLNPRASMTWVNLGVALDGRDRSEEAAAAYRRALDADPNNKFALFNLGNYHLRREQLSEAIGFYRRAVAADPSLAQGHYLMARALAQANRIDEARAAVTRALRLEPNNTNARRLEAQLQR